MAQDAVSIFAEGTASEQVQELVNYLARSKPEEEQAKFIEPFQAAVHTPEGGQPLSEDEKRRRHIFALILQETKGLGPGSEREIEGFFNLLLSHIVSLFSSLPDEFTGHIKDMVRIIADSPPPEQLPVKYRLLSNVFNSIPRDSPLRLHVYQTLLHIASSQDQLDVLQLDQAPVDRWMDEWDISPEEKSTFLKSLAVASQQSGDDVAGYSYMLRHLQMMPSSATASRQAAIDTILCALKTPSVLTFDPLLKSDSLMALRDEPIFKLLRIFMNGHVRDFLKWENDHASTKNEYHLEKNDLLSKIRSLTLAQLSCGYIGREILYRDIATNLEITEDEVDSCVIEVIHSGLVSGKLSQSQRSFHVTRSTSRSFDRTEWESLEKRLLAWKTGLSAVLEIVTASQKTVPRLATDATNGT